MQKKSYKIIISGSVGSGKTTISKLLAEKIGATFFSAGEYVRNLAIENNMQLENFMNYIENDSSYDFELHNNFLKYSEKLDSYVFDYRIGFVFEPKPFSIFLIVSDSIGQDRISGRDNVKFQKNLFFQKYNKINRDNKLRQRFNNVFGVDFCDLSKYDLVINTDNLNTNEILELIMLRI